MFRQFQEAGDRWSKASDRARIGLPRDDADRRAALRYPIEPRPIRLQWRGTTGWVSTPGLIHEYSQSGALLTVATPPPPDQVLILWLGEVGHDTRIDARVVLSGRDDAGGHRLRVQFPDGLPYAAFKALALPPASGSP